MAMFARRVLQNMLDHLALHLPLEARQKLAHGMDQQSKSALGFEWEMALLFGFSYTGKMDYEAPAAQGSRPDIVFVEDTESPIRFTADITTVSDDGLEERKSGDAPLSGAHPPQAEIRAARINPLHDQGRSDRTALPEPENAP